MSILKNKPATSKKLPKCGFCKKEFKPFKPLQMTCSAQCFYDLGMKKKAELDDKKNKEWKTKAKIKLKKLSDYEEDAKKIFQAWVRKRDQLLPCISCGKYNCKDWAGGHYFDAGVYSGLIFNEWNVNKQCNSHCNMFLGGNKPNYRIGLVKKIGIEKVVWLEENKDRLRSYKYTKEELIEIKEKYLLLMTE